MKGIMSPSGMPCIVGGGREATGRAHGSSSDIQWLGVTGIAVTLLPPTQCLIGGAGDRTGQKVG